MDLPLAGHDAGRVDLLRAGLARLLGRASLWYLAGGGPVVKLPDPVCLVDRVWARCAWAAVESIRRQELSTAESSAKWLRAQLDSNPMLVLIAESLLRVVLAAQGAERERRARALVALAATWIEPPEVACGSWRCSECAP